MSRTAPTETLTARRSTRFAAWTRAWRAGLVPFDEVAGEIAGDEEHVVSDAPGAWTDQTLREALPMLAKLHPDQIRLVLPAAGDPIGLPGPGPFTGAALDAGEGVIAGDFGFVPELREYTSGSGDSFTTVRWQVFEVADPRGGALRRGHRSRRGRPQRRTGRHHDRADPSRRRPVAARVGRRAGRVAPSGKLDRAAARLRPTITSPVRPRERARPGAGSRRRTRPRRGHQQLRGPVSRRCAPPAGDGVPARARRRLQRAARSVSRVLAPRVSGLPTAAAAERTPPHAA